VSLAPYIWQSLDQLSKRHRYWLPKQLLTSQRASPKSLRLVVSTLERESEADFLKKITEAILKLYPQLELRVSEEPGSQATELNILFGESFQAQTSADLVVCELRELQKNPERKKRLWEFIQSLGNPSTQQTTDP